jgi:pilus assembly protein CpaC
VITIKKFFSLFLLLISAEVFAQGQTITMSMGDVTVLKVADVERVAIGNDKVVQYRPLEDGELLLTAGEIGVSGIHLWMKGGRQKRYSVRVIEANISPQLKTAKKIAVAIPGLNVDEIDNKLIFSGMVAAEDLEGLAGVMGVFPGALSLVKARTFDKAPMVRLDVQIFEVSTRAAKELGIDWQKSINGPSFAVHKAFDPSITGGSFMQDPESGDYLNNFIGGWPSSDSSFYSFGNFTAAFTSRISLLAENGDARILASPKLSVKSGEMADFHAGGEYPIPYRDDQGRISVQFKQYGVKLRITPLLDADGLIDADVYTEVSAIDFGNRVLDIPGVSTRNTQTRINLMNGETLVISGLAYSESSENDSKVPLLGDVPFIGKLFTKTSRNQGNRELIISVTPIIISPQSERNVELLNVRQEFQDAFKNSGMHSALME